METYSQFGEDLEIIAHFPGGYLGYFVEVGANNGVRDSNTLLLERFGWSGILIEANAELAEAAIRARPNATVVQTAVGSGAESTVRFLTVSKPESNLDGLSGVALAPEVVSQIEERGGRIVESLITCRCLNDILREHATSGRKLDFVSIDVEGAELEVLKGLDLALHLPHLVVIEDNSKGADSTVARHMKANGYVRVHRTGWNDWYVPRSARGRFVLRSIIVRLRLTKWTLQRFLRAVLSR